MLWNIHRQSTGVAPGWQSGACWQRVFSKLICERCGSRRCHRQISTGNPFRVVLQCVFSVPTRGRFCNRIGRIRRVLLYHVLLECACPERFCGKSCIHTCGQCVIQRNLANWTKPVTSQFNMLGQSIILMLRHISAGCWWLSEYTGG